MELIYYEIYKKDKSCLPLFELIIDENNYFKNTKHVYITKNKSYCFDIQNGLFDNLREETIKYINQIFKKLDCKYLNKERWENYLKLYYKEWLTKNNIRTQYTTNILPTATMELDNSIDNIDKKTYTFKIENDLEKLYTEYNINFDLVLLYENNVYNEIDLIHKFFDIIFSRHYTLGIRKCQNCEKYFLTQPGNNFRCERIFDKNLTCSKFADKIRRQFSKDKPIQDMKKYIRDLYRHNEEKLENFSNEDYDNMKEFYGNKKKYVLFLLSHIKNEEKQIELIKRFGLSTYLN